MESKSSRESVQKPPNLALLALGLQGCYKLWATGSYLMNQRGLNFFVLGSQFSSKGCIQEAGSPKPECCCLCAQLVITSRTAWPSHWEIIPEYLCQYLGGKPQQDRTHSLPMAPLSLFSATSYPRGSEGYTDLLALQGNPRILAFKKKGVGRRMWSSHSSQLFSHDSLWPPNEVWILPWVTPHLL